MTIRPLLAAACYAALGFAPAVARELTVAVPAETLEAQKAVFLTPFMQAGGSNLQAVTWDGAMAALRSHAAAWDLVLTDGAALTGGCADGLLIKLDWQAIGGRDHYQPQAVTECGVGAYIQRFVLAWDRDKFQGVPSWSDFWDVAKFPGKRGLHRGARMNLEIALLAEGVSPADIYRTLRTDEGVDRAFRKLEQIKPYLVWWRSQDQAVKLIDSGGVLLATAPLDRIARDQAASHRFGTQANGGLYQVESWAIPKASPNQPEALKLLASMADPAEQAHFTAVTGLGTLARGINDGMSAEQLAASPSNPAMLSAALQIDDQFWHDNGDRLDERFDAWLAH